MDNEVQEKIRKCEQFLANAINEVKELERQLKNLKNDKHD